MESQNLTEISLRDLARKLREYATDAMRSPIDVSYEKAGNYALFLEIYRKDNFQILGAGLVIQIGCAVQFLEQMV
ncbi:MAG: hypothetical protein ACE5ES_05695, partial [Candidatus Nanoarchaeia archaeon]